MTNETHASENLTQISIVRHENEARQCFPVFRELRPQLDETTFMGRWAAQTAEGYEIIYIKVAETIVAVAGFREFTTMGWGRIIYLEDLVVREENRGKRFASLLLHHLQKETVKRGCAELHLATGYDRHASHRLYLRDRFHMIGYYMSWNPSHDSISADNNNAAE